jgi:hypothetical protein
MVSESFKPSAASPPRGFSFAAIRRGNTMLLVYSVHLKSNRGALEEDIAKREEAARHLLAHASEMGSRSRHGSAPGAGWPCLYNPNLQELAKLPWRGCRRGHITRLFLLLFGNIFLQML